MSGHLLASYLHIRVWRGSVAYFICKVIPTTCLTKISFQHHAFFFINHYRGADSNLQIRQNNLLTKYKLL